LYDASIHTEELKERGHGEKDIPRK
jgi:hypothetical protein